MSAGLDTDSRTAWISQGFERLVDRVRLSPAAVHFDVLIVGSGYGGAIAAATFAGRKHGGTGAPVTVGVLERGKEYLPGAFPKGLAEIPRHVRRDGNKEGLFDIRIGGDVTTVVANGVGGGSLINAGVMEVPSDTVFQSGWPSALATASAWSSFYDRASDLLGATNGGIGGAQNTIKIHPDGLPLKYQSIQALAPAGKFHAARITVAMNDTTSSGGVSLAKCIRCGDCATGCNYGAKNSLDVNLLVTAQQHGAEIFSGATVLSVERDGANWKVSTVYTDATLRARHGAAVTIRARRVVLAAGTLGSTEILLRSQAAGLPVSNAQLGRRCSTNGDMLVTDYATAAPVHTVADETVQPSVRAIGPTITGVIDLRSTAGVVIEDMSVPAGLRLAFSEVFGTVNTLHSLAEEDPSPHVQGFPDDDIYVVPKSRIEKSALYAVMGDDGAAGAIELDGAAAPTLAEDGVARMKWAGLNALPLFDDQVTALEGITAATGGRKIPNPVWKLLPANLTWLLENKRGPLTTVHPLGGCAMADSGADGVVDHLGRVFTSSTSSAVHDGLVVLDGSIIPTALGTNPSLTIAAVALRAAETLAGPTLWNFGAPAAPVPGPLARPVFRYTDFPAPAPATEVEIIERLVGPVSFKPQGKPAATRIVEITLRFAPKVLAELSVPPSDGGNRLVQVATDQSELAVRSRLRIFPLAAWQQLETAWDPARLKEQKLETIAEFSAPLSGTLQVFRREKSKAKGRRKQAFRAYLGNRGLRDAWQWLFGGEGGTGGPGAGARIKAGKTLATRSGEIRTLVYDLTIGTPDTAKIALSGTKISGAKTFTYARRANPWRQLMEVTLDTFPGLSGDERVLKLDPRYLARIGVPLFRIVGQHDGASAIAELVQFLGYALRLVLGLHIWSFRAPDKDVDPDNDVVDFKPPSVLELPSGGTVSAVRQTIALAPDKPDLSDDPTPVAGQALITRYPHPGTTKRPVVMFHGYSAGGTTFAHHAVKPNFASYFWKSGRDVWVADLRTSPEEATAVEAWSFDEIGVNDVTKVIKEAADASVDGKVDVIAHCMGTVVFSNAVLEGLVAGLVDRAAFTQVGPLVVFSPSNVFRAYLAKYLVEFLPDKYEFAPKDPTLADDLWDRILWTLPYPEQEFDVENPKLPWKRTPWTRTRHRMDALYGRDFNAEFMEDEMLRFIDEHFGRLSLKTVAQTLHFVRFSLMTDFHGKNRLVSRARLREHWDFPVYSLHGEDNGLAHVSTVDRMRQAFADAGRVYLVPFINPGAGHQDALVGTKRFAMMEQIEQFLDATIVSTPGDGDPELTAYPPWIGPIITEERSRTAALVLRVGASPALRAAEAVLLIRVQLVGEQILRPDDPTRAWDQKYIEDHMVVYSSPKLRDEGWDAFDAPLLPTMPGYDPAHPGNALLVLLIYAEDIATEDGAAKTLAFGHFVMKSGNVSWLNPGGPAGVPPPHPVGTIKLERMVQITKAAARVILTPPIGARMTQDPGAKPRKLAYLGQKSVPTAVLEITPQPVVKPGFTTLLSFGPDPNATAALEQLLDYDRDLLDGVVPYDPPASQPPSPTPGTSTTSFALASCQYPAGPIDEPVAYRAYRGIVERLEGSPGIKPRFLVFAGDQVYVDPTAGLYDPSADDDRFRLPYENWLRAQNVRDTLRRLPSFMLLDDHEIGDNWEPVSVPDDKPNDDLKKDGSAAFRKYERATATSVETFVFDGFHFFMLDTRTERSHRRADANLANATLFDSTPGGTLDRLKNWLLNKPGPKFVVSPAMLLPRHRRAVQRDTSLDPANLSALRSDGWDGYPGTLREVLAFIAANSIQNVVFLSGDEHRGCIASATLLDSTNAVRARLYSIHTPALYAPFPFANSVDEEAVLPSETIDIAHVSGNFKCEVSATRPLPGDGPTYLAVRPVGSSWALDVEFPGSYPQTLLL